MLAILLPVGDEKLFGALLFQKNKDFKVYVNENDPLAADYETKLNLVHGTLEDVQEPLVAILENGAVPDENYVGRILRATERHPDFDVYHMNLAGGGRRFPRKAGAKKVFKLTILENAAAPLSSFVFRTQKLREKAVLKADGSLDTLPTVLSCAKDAPVRNIWRAELSWTAPALSADPAEVERRIRARLDLLRWTESYFGDDDYPLSVGDQLDLFAAETVKLYPSYSPEDLKEIMAGFQVSQGAIRKMRASSALKSALKARQKALQQA